VVVVVVTALVAALPGHTQAQIGGTISYGSSVVGTLSATTQSLTYSFNGGAGDLVTVEALGLTSGLDPTVTLLGPDQQIVTTSSDDRYLTGNPDVYLSLFLPAAGPYSLVVSSQNATIGDFLLQLRGQPPGSTTPLAYDTPLSVPLSPDAAQHTYHFDTACPTTLTVDNQAAPDFAFVVRVRNAQGKVFALLRGPNKLEDRVMLPDQSGRYLLEVLSEDPAATGAITLTITCAEQAPECVSTAPGGAGVVPATADCPPCAPCDDDDAPTCSETVFTAELIPDTRNIQVTYSIAPEAEYVHLIASGLYPDGGEAYLSSVTLPAAVLGATGDFVLPDVPVHYSGIRLRLQHLAADDTVLCEDEALVEIPPLGPVEWGPAVVCSVTLLAPTEAIANGLQTFFWSEVPEATTYQVKIMNSSSVLVSGRIAPPATSLTLDVSEAAIGPGTNFRIFVEAYTGPGELCTDSVSVTRR